MIRRLVACLLVMVCLLAGCGNQDQYPAGISKEFDDIIVTLPGDFVDMSAEESAKDADFMFGRKTLVFMGISEKKEAFAGITLKAYTEKVIQSKGLTCTPIQNGDGFLFTYEKPLDNTTYTYTIATYEGTNNFWVLQFFGPKENLQENQPEIDIILEAIQPKQG